MILKLAWRNLWRNKKRSFITISSIAIAVFLAVFMRAMQLGMYSNMIKNVVGSYAGYVQVHAKGFWEEQNLEHTFILNDTLLNKINSVKGVKHSIPRLQTFSLASSKELVKGFLFKELKWKKNNFY